MYAMNKPIPTEIAPLTATGIPSKMSSRKLLPLILIVDKSKKIIPEISTIINAWPIVKLKLYDTKPTPPPIIPPTSELRPIPEACAKGIFARNAISKVPITAPNAVAMKIDDHKGFVVGTNVGP